MNQILRDLRCGLRSWARSPVVVLVTVASLGLGIGVTASIFAVANSLLFSTSTGIRDSGRVVRIYTSLDDGSAYGRTSYPDYMDLARIADTLESLAASHVEPVTLGTESPARVLIIEKVTANYFSVLGVQPVRGRFFASPEEGAAVISETLWRHHFDADSDPIGRRIELGARPYTIIGVAPADFNAGNPVRRTEAWIPLGLGRDANGLGLNRELRRLTVTGRLRQEASLQQLQAQLEVIAESLHRDHEQNFSDHRGQALSLTALRERDSRLTPDRRAVILVLALFPMAIAGLILLIACSNVATLFLARAEQRRRETAVRTALGASRRRLVSMFLIESLLPGLASGVVGIGLAWAAARAISTIQLPTSLPTSFQVGVDGRVVAFAFLLSIGTTLTFGLVPALVASKVDLVTSLKSHSGSARRPGRFGMRRLLVVAQVAASLVLIVGSSLFFRSMQGAATLDLGFDPDRIAVMTRSLPPSEYGTEAARLYAREVTRQLRALPEVEDAQASRAVELTLLSARTAAIRVAGYDADGETTPAYVNAVTAGYLEMLGVHLLQGRTIRESDTAGSPRVAVVNDVFAERFWPVGDAIGRSFSIASQNDDGPMSVTSSGHDSRQRTYQVIGVSADGKFRDIDDPPARYFWTSLDQEPATNLAILVKGRSSAEAMLPLLRAEIQPAAGEVTIIPPTTLASMVDLQMVFGRIAVAVLGWGGAFGLVLAVIGIYGIVSYSVARRTRELAIRMAVGAGRQQILRTVAGEGVILTLIGLAVGSAVVLPLARLLRAQLFGTTPTDPLAFALGAAVIGTAALVATIVPARRATMIDPMRALREE